MDPRVENKEDIVFASRIVIEDGHFPRRIVLRKLDDEYVTHQEILRIIYTDKQGVIFKSNGFENGNYFRLDNYRTDSAALQAAMDYFNERAAKL